MANQEYTACYLYYSCYQDETCPETKKVWEQFLNIELQHLHKAAECLKRLRNEEWQQVIPKGEFPQLLKFTSSKRLCKGCVKNTVYLTGHKEAYEDVNNLPEDYEFFKWQNIVNNNVNHVPSHIVIDNYIRKQGHDYRYQDSPHPVKELQDRKKTIPRWAGSAQRIKAVNKAKIKPSF